MPRWDICGSDLSRIHGHGRVEGLVLAHQLRTVNRRIERSAASGEDHRADLGHPLALPVEASEVHSVLRKPSAEAERACKGLRLLEALTQRPVRERVRRVADVELGRLFDAAEVERGTVGRHHTDLTVLG